MKLIEHGLGACKFLKIEQFLKKNTLTIFMAADTCLGCRNEVSYSRIYCDECIEKNESSNSAKKD